MTRSKCVSAMLILSALLLSACSSKPDFDFLCGAWVQGTDAEYFHETWTCDADGAKGISVQVVEGDTTFNENFTLRFIENEWVLNIRAEGENNGAYIPFYLKRWENNALYFENLKHDFPKRISYELNAKNQLEAQVDGGEGSLQIINFTFERAAAKR